MPAGTASKLAVGSTFPAFNLPDQDGRPVASESLRGSMAVVYFYPKADTSGCTVEACEFNEALPQLASIRSSNGSGVKVVGISPDPAKALKNFATKNNLTFPLLGDLPAGKNATPPFINACGLWVEKSMYGKAYMGVSRSTYLLDAKGTILHAWENVKVPGHVAEVTAAINAAAGNTPAKGTSILAEVKPAKATKTAKAAKPKAKPKPKATTKKPAAKAKTATK
nr:peroxiredoxin [Phycisphaerales bacterium]